MKRADIVFLNGLSKCGCKIEILRRWGIDGGMDIHRIYFCDTHNMKKKDAILKKKGKKIRKMPSNIGGTPLRVFG